MSESLRYKIVLWVVWVQIALLPIWLCMGCLIAHNQSWRWGLDTWVFIVGFLLGLVALPLGSGLDKPQFFKWWLRIDFCFTLILALPVLFVCSESLPTTVAEDDEYIVYSDNGFFANRSAYLARKSGLLAETIFDLWPYEGGQLKSGYYRFDKERGVFYGSKIYRIRQNGSRMWVIPLNRENYARNEDYVYHLIDSLYYAHGEWIDNDDATFILPESFTRIDYTHGNVKITDSISCDIDNAFTDSIAIYFYYPSSNKIRLSKDSVSNLSPTGVHNLIKQLKGGKR